MNISKLHLKTTCLDKLYDFYAGTLGFPIHASTADSLAVQAGQTRVVFTSDQVNPVPVYHFAFNIPQNQFAEAKAWLSARTPILSIQGRDDIHWSAWNAHAVYFVDPAGNIGELIARHNLPHDSSAPFSARSIIELSEIGLAVENVSQTAAALQTELGIRVWDKGDAETFTALGDEHGLLIVVKRGRAWFPTNNKLAGLYPVEMTIQGPRQKQYALPELPYLFNVIQHPVE